MKKNHNQIFLKQLLVFNTHSHFLKFKVFLACLKKLKLYCLIFIYFICFLLGLFPPFIFVLHLDLGLDHHSVVYLALLSCRLVCWALYIQVKMFLTLSLRERYLRYVLSDVESVEARIYHSRECFDESKSRMHEGFNNFAQKTPWPLN